jgi:hypothetical protein
MYEEALDFYTKYFALSHAHLSPSLGEERKISKCRGIVARLAKTEDPW